MANPSSLPAPDDDALEHSRRLLARIRDTITTAGGQIPFQQFMEMALYEPGLGYYVAGQRRFGAGGDFVTAPELGALFARCLARQVEQLTDAFQGDWMVLEIGAGDGSLARDLIAALPESCQPARYAILERSASLKQIQ